MKNSTPSTSNDAPPLPPVGRWYLLASLAIGFHLLAVWTAPFSVPPSSPFAATTAMAIRPYLDAAYLNHGYKFFAPDPGPTHLVRYELVMPDGSKRTGRFPDLQEQWPRLLYHRHMMLSERLDGPPDVPWIQAYARSYAEHLRQRYGASKVTLYVVTHNLPYPDQVLAGMKLDDPSLYQERQVIVVGGDGS